MKPITVSGINPTQYQQFLARLKAEKNVLVEPSATGGRASCHGVVVEWVYANSTVTATPISKPFWITEGYIDQLLNEALNPPAAKPASPAPGPEPIK
jgi:hypothetical protein